MDESIDDNLISTFQEQRVIQAFFDYKYSKWDHFSDLDNPEINIPMGSDGVKFEAFEKQLLKNVQNICNRVIQDKYLFYPFRELEIEKEPASNGKPTKFRTLSIASIRDVLVQTLLYEHVLYKPIEALFSKLDFPSTVSFAYRKGKSAPKAAQALFSYIQEGYWYVFDADLSKYFDSIPHDLLLNKLSSVIGGTESLTFKLVNRFIHTDRVPYDSYKKRGFKVFHWKKPKRVKREKGVPQGGVLSGMLANLYLHDFDCWIVNNLSSEIDLRYVRYADDFVILLREPENLNIIHTKVREQIEFLKLKLNEEKTAKKDIREEGLEFVGFHFDAHYLRIRERNIDRYKKRIIETICSIPNLLLQQNNPIASLKWLVRRVNYKVQGHSCEERCPRCGETRVGSPRSWIAFFQVVTDQTQLRNIDKWTRQFIYDFIYKEYKVRIKRDFLRKIGYKSLVNEKYRIPSSNRKPCICDIDDRGVWIYVEDMFQGKIIYSLALKKPFYVKKVDEQKILVIIGNNEYEISKELIMRLWEHLTIQGNLKRSDLEQQGIKNTSQIVALLAQFPGVKVNVKPINLLFIGKQTAEFLLIKTNP